MSPLYRLHFTVYIVFLFMLDFIKVLLFDSEIKESLERSFKRSRIKVSYYDEYHETDELFFVDGEKYTLQGIKLR